MSRFLWPFLVNEMIKETILHKRCHVQMSVNCQEDHCLSCVSRPRIKQLSFANCFNRDNWNNQGLWYRFTKHLSLLIPKPARIPPLLLRDCHPGSLCLDIRLVASDKLLELE